MEITDLREVSVKDLRSFIAERGYSYASLLERHELKARAEEAAAASQQCVVAAADSGGRHGQRSWRRCVTNT